MSGSWVPIIRLIEMLMDIYQRAKAARDIKSVEEAERVIAKWGETRDWFLSLGRDDGGE